jgi:hypothetical protein
LIAGVPVQGCAGDPSHANLLMFLVPARRALSRYRNWNADSMIHYRLSRLFVLIIAVPAMVASFAAPALCQEERGGYVGVTGLLGFTFDGNVFDGESAYIEVGGEEVMILPKLEKKNLIRAILGHRWEKGAFEVSYDRTKHDGLFLGESGEATFQAVNFDGRFFMLTQGPVQPHVLVGGSIPWLRIKDGSFLDPVVGDARFRGYGVNTEAGVTMFPHPKVGVSVGYSYRVMWFDRASGATDKLFELRPRFRETSGSVAMSGVFTF